jgi:tape measure domain-containing protein
VSVVANVAINVDSSGAVSKLRQVQQGAQSTSQAVDKLNATTAATSDKFKIAANGIKYFTDAAGRARAENGRFLTTAERAAAGIEAQGNAAQQAAGKLNGLRGAVVGLGSAFGGIAAVLGVIQAGRFVFAKTAEVESQSRSLAILAGSAEKAGQIIKELQQLGAVTPFTSTELIDSAKRLQAFGVEADKVVETTRRLADASGATGAELSGLVTAYGQVQAKGRLQGEELLQFQERGIALQEELRKMYGMTGEEFQKALSKGQVSAKAVEVALANLTSTGGKYANGAIAQSDTLNGRLSTLQDNVDGVAREVGKVLTPVLITTLQQLNTSLSQTPAFVEDIALAFQYAAGQLKPFLNGLSQMQWFFTNLTPPGWAMQMIGGAAERGKSTIRGAASLQRQSQQQSFIGPAAPQMQGPAVPKRLREITAQTPGLLGATSGGGATGGKGKSDAEREAERAAKEAARESQRVADVIKNQQFITQQLEVQLRFANEIFEAEQKGDAIRVLNLQTLEQQVLAENDIAKAMKEEADPAAKLAIAAAGRVKLQSITNKGVQDVIALQVQQEKSFDAIIADLELELALKTATTEEAREQLRLENELRKLKGQGFTDEQVGQITGLQAQIAAPDTAAQTIEKRIGTLKDEITDLTNIGNIAITVADGIGAAFGQAFQGLISGSMSAKEALSGFFKSVADMFLEMAAQIIAKQITMIILQTILKALGGAPGGGGGGGLSSGFDAGTSSALPTDAAGWGQSFATKLPGRAMGGPVSSQQPYMVGERGPELFVPSNNGGVMSNNDLRSAMGSRPSSNGSTVLNMSFQSTTINGVEYVSRDQLEAAMAQTRRDASNDGAKRGMSMTLDKLQQSPSTRRKVGI